jgi:hypothetical protein
MLAALCAPETDVGARRGRRSACLPCLINLTARNKGLRHNKARCLRIVRPTCRHQESFRNGRGGCNAS